MLCKESQSSQLMKSQSLRQVWQRPSTSMSLAWAFVPCTGARGRNQLEITPGNVGCSPRSCKVKFSVGNANGLSQFFLGAKTLEFLKFHDNIFRFFLVSETWDLAMVQEIILYQLGKDRKKSYETWVLWGTSFRDFQVGSWGLHSGKTVSRVFFTVLFLVICMRIDVCYMYTDLIFDIFILYNV